MTRTSARTLDSFNPSRNTFRVIAADGDYYWVTLKTEARSAYKALACMIANACGPSTVPAIIDLDEHFVQVLNNQRRQDQRPFKPQACYGSRLPANPSRVSIYDWIPAKTTVINRDQLVSMLALDVWLGNQVAGHAVYARQPIMGLTGYVTGFGQAFQFGAPPKLIQPISEVSNIWQLLHAGIQKIDELSAEQLKEMASSIPVEWWKSADRSACEIIEALLERRCRLHSLMADFCRTHLSPDVSYCGTVKVCQRVGLRASVT